MPLAPPTPARVAERPSTEKMQPAKKMRPAKEAKMLKRPGVGATATERRKTVETAPVDRGTTLRSADGPASDPTAMTTRTMTTSPASPFLP